MDTAAQPAIGYSITVDVAPGRQIVFQHFVGDDETDAAVNARLDRLMAFADRQRAKYELPDITEELLKMTDEIAQLEQDRAETELRHREADRTFDNELARMAVMRETTQSDGYAKHLAQGKQGSFKPAGATKSTIEKIEHDVTAINDQRAKNNAERDQFLGNMEIAVKRREDRIATLEAKREAIQAKLT